MFRTTPPDDSFDSPTVVAEAVFYRDPSAPPTPDGTSQFGDDWLSRRSASEKQTVRSMFPADCELLFGVRDVVLLVPRRGSQVAPAGTMFDAREFSPRLPEENNPWE